MLRETDPHAPTFAEPTPQQADPAHAVEAFTRGGRDRRACWWSLPHRSTTATRSTCAASGPAVRRGRAGRAAGDAVPAAATLGAAHVERGRRAQGCASSQVSNFWST